MAVADDRKLRQSVMDELDFEPRIDSTDIGVLVEGNVVTLTGHVPTYGQKAAAERAVWRVRGVRVVVQNIEVRCAGGRPSDEELALRALRLLKWDSTVPVDVHLTVDRGWLTLEGEVDWHFQRSNAESDLRHLAGLSGITNSITLRPAAQQLVLKRRIEAALRRNAEVGSEKIRVEVADGGVVTLGGSVSTWSQRRAAERTAWSAPGVSSVVDELTIG